MEHVHRIVYINLDKRTDRRHQIESELQKLRVPSTKIERFAAIENAQGCIGCSLSHLAVLRRARREQWPNVLVLEDDFCLCADADQLEMRLEDVFHSPGFDVFMLAYSIPDSKLEGGEGTGMLVPTQNAQTTAAYLVHRDFYDTLINNVAEGVQLLQQTFRHWDFAVDQYWKRLQPKSRWFHSVPRLCFQRASYSDCAQKFIDYGV